jgi:glycosyltransferase involved in cell wall biosynthesis
MIGWTPGNQQTKILPTEYKLSMSYRKIRVLQLIDTFNVGGAEKVALALATKTDRNRFEVVPCAVFRSGPLEEEMKSAGILYRILSMPRRSVLTGPLFFSDLCRMVAAVRRVIRELEIDIVHTHLTNSTLIATLATSGKSRIPLCATVHSIIFDNQRSRLSPRTWVMRAGLKATFWRANRIIAVSEKVAQAVQSYTDVASDRLVTITNGVDADRFDCRESRKELRRKLNLPTDRPVVVSVGRLTRPKGYPHLLAALSLIPPGERPLALIVGDGPDLKDLRCLAAALKLDEDVQFLGTRSDIPALLSAADVFVLASLWEGLPLALLEAMAAGLPSVVTAVGENPAVIQDGRCGFLVPPGDEAALAYALNHLLRDPLQRKLIGNAARQRFEDHFTEKRCIEAHEVLYCDLMAESQAAHLLTKN